MPKATSTLTPSPVVVTSGKAALAKLEINEQLAKFATTPANHPDAELIRLCIRHPQTSVDAVEFGVMEDKRDRYWLAYFASCDAIHDAKPQTIEGMLAKAWAAKIEAVWLDGSEHPANCPAETWSWDLLNDLIRLNAAPSPDAELIRLCGQFMALNKEADAAFDEETNTLEAHLAVEYPAYLDRARPLLQQILELRAKTPAGLEARLNMALLWLGELEDHVVFPADLNHQSDWANAMTAAFFRDAIGHDPIIPSRSQVEGGAL